MKIVVDYDDVLSSCNLFALEQINETTGKKYSLYDLTQWGVLGIDELDSRLKFFSEESFVQSQPLYEGAVSFIEELAKRHDVIIFTSVPLQMMTCRAMRIRQDFPFLPTQNIILGGRKDCLDVDVHIDDNPKNLIHSTAKLKILFRRPWNNVESGCVAANSFDDCLNIIKRMEKPMPLDQKKIICLVGPTGGKKKEKIVALTEKGYRVPISLTTKKFKIPPSRYLTVSKQDFEQQIESGKLLEYSVYGNEYYGIVKEHFELLLSNNKIVLSSDYCGANRLKAMYGDDCIIVFCPCTAEENINAVLNSDAPHEEKVLRISSYAEESKLSSFCDVSWNEIF